MTRKTSPQTGTILVVDDEPPILGVLEQYLGDRGFAVVTAATGGAALERGAGVRFDVALLDLKLPDMTGLELLARLRERQPELACIVMTGYASLESTIEAVRLSAFDYILKPFDLIKIGEIVDAAYSDAVIRRENAEIIARLERANRRLEESKRDLDDRIVRANEELSTVNESLKRHVTRLKMLYQMGRDISSNENWSDSLDRFLMALCRYLEADGSALLLWSDGGKRLQVRTFYQLDAPFLDGCVEALHGAQERDALPSEIFVLESCSGSATRTCLEAKRRWEHTVVPLIYKGRWLGLLVIRKIYRSRLAYLHDYHFINTIQTILTEEVANAANISRLRNLKNFNETILENIASGVLTTDGAGRIIFLNRRAKEMCGIEAAGERRFDEVFVNPYGRSGIFEYLIGRPERSSSFEGLLVKEGGGTIPVRLSATTVDHDENRGAGLVVIFEDLTEQKRMEEELRRADRLRSLGELSAGVAHEIRNPLTGIATTAQVLREKLAGEQEKLQYLGVILGEINRLDDIIKNLLNFARPVSPSPSEVSVGDLIESAVELLEDRAREAGVSLAVSIDVADSRCLLDGDQIKQVILNIVLNGIQACRAGGRVAVCLRQAADPAFIQIEVADTGAGVPDEIADRLYNPFFTTRPDGTGMGLSISRKIAESHGGRIYHRSVPGAGASFFVELPQRLAAAARDELANVR